MSTDFFIFDNTLKHILHTKITIITTTNKALVPTFEVGYESSTN